MNLRRFVNKKVVVLTAVVFAVVAGSAAAMAMSGDGTIVGSQGPDQIAAGNSDDHVYGQGGADVIFAGNGNDTIDGDGNCGTQTPGVYPNGLNSTTGCEDGQNQNGDANPGEPGPGPGDTISAGNGDDMVFGGAGLSNIISVGRGNDTIYGGPYNDVIATGSGGQATITLGPGNNIVSVGKVANGGTSVVNAFIVNDPGTDTITCHGGHAIVYANERDHVKGCDPHWGYDPRTNPLAARDFALRARIAKANGARAHKSDKRHSTKARNRRAGR